MPSAATVGIIYGYDSSNIGGALLFIAEELDLSVGQQQLVTTAVVVGGVLGALLVLHQVATVTGIIFGHLVFWALADLVVPDEHLHVTEVIRGGTSSCTLLPAGPR